MTCPRCGRLALGAEQWCMIHGSAVDYGREDWQSTWKDAVRKPGIPEHLTERIEQGERVEARQAATDYNVTVRTAERWLRRMA